MNKPKSPKRTWIIVAAAVSLGLAGIWLAPYAIGDDDTYDDTTRTVTVVVQKKEHHPSPRPGGKDKCKDSTGKNGKDSKKCLLDPGADANLKTVEDTVRQAMAQLQLPANTPVFGPSPSQNQWAMVPVGYPIWLWSADSTTRLTRSVTHDGLSIALTATRASITFAMGDAHSVTCATFSQRPSPMKGDPMRPSPNCGYVYSATGRYTITAATAWIIQWHADGQSGTLRVVDTVPAASPIVIGELRTVITGGGQKPR